MEKIIDYLAEEEAQAKRQATKQRKAGKKDRITSLLQDIRNVKAQPVNLDFLAMGSKRKADIDHALKENGFKPDALDFDAIKKRCKAKSRPLSGKGAGWEWFLPTPEQAVFDSVA